ncbi:MAG: DUF2953 domain-containing protein [Lachnospirales bacterium]
MAVVFLILKIIGIILLILLALVLFLLLILLLVPFKYKFYLNKEDNFEIDAKFTWLFSIISVQYILKDKKDDLKIRIPFLFNKDDNIDEVEDNKSEEVITEVHSVSNSDINLDVIKEEKSDFKEYKKPKKENKGKILKSKVKEKVKFIKSKLKEIKTETKKYKKLYRDFDREFGAKKVFKIALKFLKNIIKAIKPKTFVVEGTFGLSDPADTGMVYAFISIITSYLPGKYYIKGDFENNIIKGSINIKGRSSLFFISIPVIKLILTKPVLDITKKYWR